MCVFIWVVVTARLCVCTSIIYMYNVCVCACVSVSVCTNICEEHRRERTVQESGSEGRQYSHLR